jgi:hypothetical protein
MMKMMKMITVELARAVDGLYSAFSSATQSPNSESSPFSAITAEQIAALYSKPLRSLTVDDLQRYARAAMTTWGTEQEFKHYLPRFFELLVTNPGWTSAELLLGKLSEGGWTCWGNEQRAAILAYIHEMWKWALVVGPDVVDASDILSGCGLAGVDPDPLFAIWRGDEGLAATRQLARLISHERQSLPASLDRRWIAACARRWVNFSLTRTRLVAWRNAICEMQNTKSWPMLPTCWRSCADNLDVFGNWVPGVRRRSSLRALTRVLS